MIEFIAGCFVGVAIAKKVRAIAEWQEPSYLKIPPYIRIVEISKGKYAVRRGYFFDYDWLGLEGGYWWSSRKYVEKHCLGSIEECKEAMEHKKPFNGTPI